MTSVPRAWPGATVVCIATGASLTGADVEACHGRARVIAINNAYTIAPWADALYAGDQKWWQWHQGAPLFMGLKYTVEPQKIRWPGLQVLRHDGGLDTPGLCLDPTGVRTGFNSGYQAINLAVHFGAARIVLLGYDMHGGHFFGEHPDSTAPPFARCLGAFATLVTPLAELGISIVNCSPQSALHSFPMLPLQMALMAGSSASLVGVLKILSTDQP